jgi:membrane protein DedA with SNARE-associated domain
MSLIQGLHGIVAIVLFCGLLFAEETGLPLPLPGELMLIAAGVLIGTGGLDPWLFPPLAYASCLAGEFTGYSWARLVGTDGLRRLAERIHQERRVDRVASRLRAAGPKEIAISRLLPGLRIYTTLVVGAAGVSRNRFLIGVAPATAVWLTFFLVLGIVVGAPAEAFLGQLEGLVLQGGVLIVVGVAGYVAIRSVPENAREMMLRLQPGLRTTFAVLVDLGLIASIVAGVLAVIRPLTPAGDIAGWVDVVAVIVVIAVFYSVATRRGTHATAGEKLFGGSYLTRHASGGGGVRARVRRALTDGPGPDGPDAARVELFRALSDATRLRMVELLLVRERSEDELARLLACSPEDAAYRLQELHRAGVVHQAEGPPDHALWAVADKPSLYMMLSAADRTPDH